MFSSGIVRLEVEYHVETHLSKMINVQSDRNMAHSIFYLCIFYVCFFMYFLKVSLNLSYEYELILSSATQQMKRELV